jgi:hypothetical protein
MGQEAAGPLSIATIGLSVVSDITKAQGTKAADEYQAASLDRAAQYGEVKADQTSAVLTQRLNQTLGNIDVIRAAAHDDPTSPTGAAYRDYQERIGVGQRSTEVGNILAQSAQQEADAAYLRTAGNNALLSGTIGALGTGLGGIAGGIKNFGWGISGGGPLDAAKAAYNG